jgi:DNA-binding MarR family transcriptional regulator
VRRSGNPRSSPRRVGDPAGASGGSSVPTYQTLETLFRETVSLFHRMRSAAESVHRDYRIRGGERGILMSLHRHGPQTIPQLARARPVSRQHIQAHVTPLASKGLVEFLPNPAHRKSHLVTLTEKGKKMVEEMRGKEKRLLSSLPLKITQDKIEESASVLRAVRQAFESDDWNRLVAEEEEEGQGKTGRGKRG